MSCFLQGLKRVQRTIAYGENSQGDFFKEMFPRKKKIYGHKKNIKKHIEEALAVGWT